MRNSRKLFAYLNLIALVPFFMGCNANIIDEPSITKLTTGGSTTVLAIPKDVSATQGNYESVTVSWVGCNAASRYFVYSAESPFDTFVQCGETKGTETFLSITEPAGSSKFYKVSAVKFDGSQSSLSSWAKGTTIAKPVITSISKNDDNNSATITWWMENCNSSTYISKIHYLIQGKKGTSSAATISIDISGADAIDTYTIENLEGKTDYSWTVSAYTVTKDGDNNIISKAEVSNEVSITTAHRLIPLAPKDFTATTGLSDKGITLSWLFPDKTDVQNDDGTYTEHPNFFVIYRKYAGSPDSTYEVIKVFTADGGKRTVNNIEYSSVSFESYEEGQLFEYMEDDKKNPGTKYEYKIKAFVDHESSKTSSVSESTSVGYLISTPSISTSSEYEIDPENQEIFKSATVKFSTDFNSMMKDNLYSFVLVEKKNDIENDLPVGGEWPKIIGKSNSISTACEPKTFTDMQEEKGYYRYELFIIPRVTSNDDYENYETTKITSAPANGKITITDDTNSIPDLESIEIADGFKDCYKLTWKFDKECTYILSWLDGEGNKGQYTLTEQDTKDALDKTNFTFVHKGGSNAVSDPVITSGDRRLYTVTANKGITKSVSAENYSMTLGTAKPEMSDNDYKSITVRWPVVQKADSYKLSAKLKKKESDISGTECTFTSTESTINIDGTDYIEYKLDNISDYDDSEKSGLPIEINVCAINSETSDSTNGNLNSYLIGPALTEPSINNIYIDRIEFNWKKATGANGYLIHRAIKLYSDETNDYKDSTSFITYYVSADCQTIEAENEERSSDCVEVKFNAETQTYTLVDKYHESNSENPGAYEFSQAAIAWGVPFSYRVVPLKNNLSDMETITLDHSIRIKGDKEYKNLTSVDGSTYGFGLNVMASKCESDADIFLKWKKPFKTKFAPHLYRRKAGSNENSWNIVQKANIGTDDDQFTIKFNEYFDEEESTLAFEYAIAYYSTQSTGYKLPPSLVNNSSNGGLASIELTDENKRYSYKDPSKAEKRNKGYLLRVNNFSAYYGGTATSNLFTEKISWSNWDYDERGIGPEKYTIYIKNRNLLNSDSKDLLGESGWVEIITLNSDADFTENLAAEKIRALNNDIILKEDPYQLSLTSKSLEEGATNTDGLLKVLRDPRHYYQIIATIGEINGATGHDGNVYAYRQITNEELVKACMLAFTYGFYINDGGNPNYKSMGQFKYGDTGSFSTSYIDENGAIGVGNATFEEGKYVLSGKYNAGYSYMNYAPVQLCPDGSSQSFLCLTKTDSNRFRMRGTSDYFLFQFQNEHTIKVKAWNQKEMPDYSAEIKFKAPNNNSLTISITRNGSTSTIVDTSDNATRKTWFPMQIHGDKSYEITSTSYGWWPTK